MRGILWIGTGLCDGTYRLKDFMQTVHQGLIFLDGQYEWNLIYFASGVHFLLDLDA